MDLIPVSEVRVGDVFSDIRVTVSHTEPLSEMLQVLDGIWAQSEEAALADFAKQAERYADYVTDPVREAASYDALMKDIAVWGCE